MRKVTSSELSQLINTLKTPLLIKFEASWCGPCKRFAPEVEAAERELAGSVDVVAVDIDEVKDQADRFGVKSVPTIVLLGLGHDGKAKELRRRTGLVPAKQVVSWVMRG